MTPRSWALAGVAVVATLAACDGPADDEMSREAQIYLAAVREVIAEQVPPSTDDELPVVYVVPVGESDIDATVQAEVAGELHDLADVRFADERSEAVEEDEDGMPVRDDGTLVAIEEVPADGEPIDVEVEVYRSAEDSSHFVFTFGPRSSRWVVTSTSVLPLEAP